MIFFSINFSLVFWEWHSDITDFPPFEIFSLNIEKSSSFSISSDWNRSLFSSILALELRRGKKSRLKGFSIESCCELRAPLPLSCSHVCAAKKRKEWKKRLEVVWEISASSNSASLVSGGKWWTGQRGVICRWLFFSAFMPLWGLNGALAVTMQLVVSHYSMGKGKRLACQQCELCRGLCATRKRLFNAIVNWYYTIKPTLPSIKAKASHHE